MHVSIFCNAANWVIFFVFFAAKLALQSHVNITCSLMSFEFKSSKSAFFLYATKLSAANLESRETLLCELLVPSLIV